MLPPQASSACLEWADSSAVRNCYQISDLKIATTRTCIKKDEASLTVRVIVCWCNALTVSPVNTGTVTELTVIITHNAVAGSTRNAVDRGFGAAVAQANWLLLLQIDAAGFASAGRGTSGSTR
jgi:hypothetical protein